MRRRWLSTVRAPTLQLIRGVAVGEPRGEEHQHLPLARREHHRAGRSRLGSLGDRGGKRRVDVDPTVQDREERRDQERAWVDALRT